MGQLAHSRMIVQAVHLNPESMQILQSMESNFNGMRAWLEAWATCGGSVCPNWSATQWEYLYSVVVGQHTFMYVYIYMWINSGLKMKVTRQDMVLDGKIILIRDFVLFFTYFLVNIIYINNQLVPKAQTVNMICWGRYL